MQPEEQAHWHGKLAKYQAEEWANKPSLFAEFAVSYFPPSGALLELGSGSGQDSVYFATKGFEVTQTDAIDDAFADSKINAKNNGANLIQQIVDLWNPLEFADNTFDIVYAQLVLHYFDSAKTADIFREIHRILKPSGIFAAMFNSTDDPEYGQGVEIEPNYFQVDRLRKMYFSTDTLRPYLNEFNIDLLDNEGQTYKDLAKGVRRQIRLIAKK